MADPMFENLLLNAREAKSKDGEESPSIGDLLKTISLKLNSIGNQIKESSIDTINVVKKLLKKENDTVSDKIEDIRTSLEKMYENKQLSTITIKQNNREIQKSIQSSIQKITGSQSKSFKEMKTHIDNNISSLQKSISSYSSSEKTITTIVKNQIDRISKNSAKMSLVNRKILSSISKKQAIISKSTGFIKSGFTKFLGWFSGQFKTLFSWVGKIWDFVKFARIALPLVAFMVSPPGLILLGGILISALIYSPKFRDFMLGIVDWAFNSIKGVIDKFLPAPIANVLNFFMTVGYEAIKGLITFLGELSANWDKPMWWLDKLQGLGNWLIDKILDYGDVLMDNIIKPISSLLESILPKPVVDVLAFLGRKFNEGLEGLFTFFFELKDNWKSWDWWKENFSGMGHWLLSSFLEYGDLLLNWAGYVRDSIIQYIPGFKPFLDFFSDTFRGYLDLVVKFWTELPGNWDNPSWWLERLSGVGEFIIDRFMAWGNVLKDALFSLLDMIPGVDLKGATEEFSNLTNSGENAAYAGAASIGVALNLRESESERQAKFSELSKQTDISTISNMFKTSMAKLKLIEAFSAGYDQKEALAAVERSSYIANEYIRNGVKSLADSITTSGLHWEALIDMVWPSAYNLRSKGTNIGSATDSMLGIDNGNSVKQLSNVLNSITENLSKSGISYPEISPSYSGNDIIKASAAALSIGGVVTEPTLTYIGEAGDNEAVIPLNEQGVEFMKKTILSALGEIKAETPESIEIDARDDAVEKKLDGLIKTISQLIGTINNSNKGQMQQIAPVENIPDPLTEFSKMIASGVLSNRKGGI